MELECMRALVHGVIPTIRQGGGGGGGGGGEGLHAVYNFFNLIFILWYKRFQQVVYSKPMNNMTPRIYM